MLSNRWLQPVRNHGARVSSCRARGHATPVRPLRTQHLKWWAPVIGSRAMQPATPSAFTNVLCVARHAVDKTESSVPTQQLDDAVEQFMKRQAELESGGERISVSICAAAASAQLLHPTVSGNAQTCM